MASNTGVSLRTLLLASLAAAALVVGGFYVRQKLTPPKPADLTPVSSTRPATASAKAANAVEALPRSYMDLVRATYKDYPTTQPLPRPIDTRFAGHFILPDPLLLDRTGRLWITRLDAEPTETLLAPRIFPQEILTRERPVYVHWPPTRSATDTPYLICPTDSGFELVTADARTPLGKGADYDWPRATSSANTMVVPTSHGLSVFAFNDKAIPTEHASPALVDASAPHAPVQFVFDWKGITAWAPPTDAHPGSNGIARFVDDAWTTLSPDKGWPERILHLIPLLDGSVLQILQAPEHTIKLAVVSLDPANVDEQAIARLIAYMSHDDAEQRDKAFKQLAAFGPGALPVIDRLMLAEPPETKSRLRELLRSRVEPLLGHMQVVGNKLRLVSRFPDGGVLFHAERGIALPRGEEQPELVPQAWVCVRPGQLIRLIDPEMMREFDPKKHTLTPWYDEWILSDAVQGPRRYLGNAFMPLLKPSEIEQGFTHFTGLDRQGRYLFRKRTESSPTTSPTTSQPSTGNWQLTTGNSSSTLLIDPQLPDPTPRLPVWEIVIQAEEPEAGWNQNHWPAMKSGGAWALGEREWRAIKEDAGDRFHGADSLPPAPTLTTRPTSAPTTLPEWTTKTPIYIAPDGAAYFDGQQSLKLLKPDNTTIDWPLPGQATGTSRPWLVRAAHDRLFLFNEPGRLLRIRPNPNTPENPFTVEATFTHKIPNYAPTRMWLDPFGRICFAYQETLTITFPEGYVPPSIFNVIPGGDQDDLLRE